MCFDSASVRVVLSTLPQYFVCVPVPDFPRALYSPTPTLPYFARRASTASYTHLLFTSVFPSIFGVSPVAILYILAHMCSVFRLFTYYKTCSLVYVPPISVSRSCPTNRVLSTRLAFVFDIDIDFAFVFDPTRSTLQHIDSRLPTSHRILHLLYWTLPPRSPSFKLDALAFRPFARSRPYEGSGHITGYYGIFR